MRSSLDAGRRARGRLGAAGLLLLVAGCGTKTASGKGDASPPPGAKEAGSDGNTADALRPPDDAHPREAGHAEAAADAGADVSYLYSDAAPPSISSLPAKGAFLGAFVDIINGYDAGDATDTDSEKRFVDAEELIGRKWAIDNRFYNDSTEIVSDRTLWDKANKIIPLITWMPYGNGDPLVEYIEGEHDALVHAEAQKLKALGVQVFMRWGHEMNGNWYPWSGSMNGEGGIDAGADGGASDGGGDGGIAIPSSGPGKYIAAWRHVHDIFVEEQATNVLWVWTPNGSDVPEVPWNHWTEYYPGDAYVDWVGLDVYNWGTSSSCCVWTSFAALMTGSPYQDYASTKPIMIPETASAEVGGNKEQWIEDMHQDLETEFQAVRAVVWFDIDKETAWQINSSPGALTAFKAMAQDPYFNLQ